MSRKEWHLKEEEFLVNNYTNMTIKELKDGLSKLSSRDRTADSINAKIKRLKSISKIEGQKDKTAVQRSLKQRKKDTIPDNNI